MPTCALMWRFLWWFRFPRSSIHIVPSRGTALGRGRWPWGARLIAGRHACIIERRAWYHARSAGVIEGDCDPCQVRCAVSRDFRGRFIDRQPHPDHIVHGRQHHRRRGTTWLRAGIVEDRAAYRSMGRHDNGAS
jgi:hypothetical protein